MNKIGCSIELLRRQRDGAFACMALALIIALTLIASNIGSDRDSRALAKAINENARRLNREQSVLDQNKKELENDVTAVEAIRKTLSSKR